MKSFKIIRPNRFFAMEVSDSVTGEVQRLPLYAYMTYQPPKGCYEPFLDAGVKLMIVSVYAGDRGINPHSAIRPFRPGFMTTPGEYDFRHLEEDLKIATCGRKPGEVYVLLRVMLEMPLWWEEAHPEARCLDASGTPLHCSFSSAEWLDASEAAIRALHEWLEKSGWSDYIAGYHLAGGSTEEYIRPKLHEYQLCDYSACSRAHFCRWLAEQYAGVEALNAAWGTALTDFAQASIPTPVQRRYYRKGAFRDPAAEQQVIDHARFISEELVAFVGELATRAKAICDGQKLVGAFYGYTSINDPNIGHNAVGKLLACEAVDFLASPFCYTKARDITVDWPFQGPIESTMLHGKPWFTEADVRTCLSRPLSQCMTFADPEANPLYDLPVWWGPKTVELSVSQMARAYARVFTHGSAIWWFDMWGGWYDDDAMMDFHRFARQHYEEATFAPAESAPGLGAQLAVFVDKDALNGIGCGYQMVAEQLEALTSLGAPFDVYVMSDFTAVDPAPYRMALLLSPATALDAVALARWKKGGRTLFFVGIPGYFAGDKAIGKDGEIACKVFSDIAPTQGIWRGKRFPEGAKVMPEIALLPADADVILARNEEGYPMTVLHPGDGYQTVWSLPICPPTALIREQLALAGGHIYAHSGDAVYAGGDIVALLAASDGDKRLYFPFAGAAYDAVTGKRLPGTELYAEFSLKAGECRMLRLVKGNRE